ncbi:MAG: hypothetical protein ABWX96_21230 [Propionibacteriaceae bacterium]
MTGLLGLAALIIVLLMSGWWLSWIATRLDRAHARVERAWAVLDTALVRRAQQAVEMARQPPVDPATTLLVCDAAGAALELDLTAAEREQAESTLSHVLDLAALSGLEAEQERATLARRLYNDAVTTARTIRQRPVVRIFRLAGFAAEPRPFEMADDQRLVWSGGKER